MWPHRGYSYRLQERKFWSENLRRLSLSARDDCGRFGLGKTRRGNGENGIAQPFTRNRILLRARDAPCAIYPLRR